MAVGHRLTESNDRILRVEGRDAGLGLAARRIATALTKDEERGTSKTHFYTCISFRELLRHSESLRIS